MEPMPQPPDTGSSIPFPNYFWAKTTKDGQPGISVRDHCLNVGCVAEALFKQLPKPLQDLLTPGAVTLAALHDVGKITPGFQAQCGAGSRKTGWTSMRSYEKNHALVSKCFINQVFDDEMLEPWAEAIGAHHGFPNEGRNFTREPDDEPGVLTAALFAEHPKHSSSIWNLGATWRAVCDKHRDRREQEPSDPEQLRFRRLIACDAEELADHLLGIVRFAKNTGDGVPINYETLWWDLREWFDPKNANRPVKLRWACGFHRATPEPEPTNDPAPVVSQ